MRACFQSSYTTSIHPYRLTRLKPPAKTSISIIKYHHHHVSHRPPKQSDFQPKDPKSSKYALTTLTSPRPRPQAQHDPSPEAESNDVPQDQDRTRNRGKDKTNFHLLIKHRPNSLVRNAKIPTHEQMEQYNPNKLLRLIGLNVNIIINILQLSQQQ